VAGYVFGALQPASGAAFTLTYERRTTVNWVGRARIVGFKAEPDENGNARWDVYATEPEQRREGATREAQDDCR
jgi:hypothetical protein